MDEEVQTAIKETRVWKNRKTINKYLKRINYNNDRPLGPPQVRQLFMEFMKDYVSYKITPDELDKLCLATHDLVADSKIVRHSRIFNIINDAFDLSWDLRINPERAGVTIRSLIEKYEKLKKGEKI